MKPAMPDIGLAGCSGLQNSALIEVDIRFLPALRAY
jgi:hypothetical protein